MKAMKKSAIIKLARKEAKAHGMNFVDKRFTINGRPVYELVCRETGDVKSGNLTLTRICTFIEGDRLSSAFARMAKSQQYS